MVFSQNLRLVSFENHFYWQDTYLVFSRIWVQFCSVLRNCSFMYDKFKMRFCARDETCSLLIAKSIN